jgi:hypothetical protein
MERDEAQTVLPNPGGARWCPEHGRFECTKNRKHGAGPCHAAAVSGTDVCCIHSGKRKEVLKVQGQIRKRVESVTAWNPAGGTPDIDYRMAVLGVLQMTWLRLSTYSELLRRQVELEEGSVSEYPGHDNGEYSGLIGYHYGAAGKDGRVYVQSEEVRALVTLEAAERSNVVRYAKVAHDMGISDRLTSLAERWGDVVAGRVSVMLEALNLTPEQASRVPELVSAYLGSIDVDAIGAVDQGKRVNGGRLM